MKKVVVLFTLCVFTAFVVSSAFSAEPPKEKETPRTVIGTVSVIKDANGIKEITLKTAVVKYNVVLDEKGKALAALDGKKAKITGIIELKGKVEWIKVEKFEEEPAAPPKKK